ncbi:hypothetical protein VBD025_04370 [Virgibacillus flavescens]|uniref:hypothetical protein n=1 Tax=Virgibacillus flavescens TaxID=1611422 RepID=UPI003D346850
MNITDWINKCNGEKWFRVTGFVVKATLGLVLAAAFICCAILIYLVIQDYFYDEPVVDKNETIESIEMEANS